jgi:hypothetical protein
MMSAPLIDLGPTIAVCGSTSDPPVGARTALSGHQFGDAVTPTRNRSSYPVLLDEAARAPRACRIHGRAEFHAICLLGMANLG